VNDRGFTAGELVVVMAIVGILAATSLPWMINYWRSATLKGGAEELAAGLNRGRQLAISQSRNVCVEVVGNRYRYRLNDCVGAPWPGPGTDATGFYGMSNNVGVAANQNPIFGYLGAANPGATFTVTNPQDGATLLVVVAVSGRVRICPGGGCPP
jgi:prepilin-type N-terminal cleavage/methylation domain-containing protein